MAGSTSAIGFKWLDLLEKEFDKSYVGLDHHLAGVVKILQNDDDALEAYDVQRKLLSNMAHCFVQLAHKSQAIFQSNAKLEAELIHVREEMTKAKSSSAKSDSEKQYLICCLQSALLENHKLKNIKKGGSPDGPDVDQEDKICLGIQMRLANEMAAIQRVDWDSKRMEIRCEALERDLEKATNLRAELESELVGARLDAKYLDKELAGRIQQIQILLAANTSQEHKQKVWSQIEAEMHLQRSKTISNMCYSKQRVRDSLGKEVMGKSDDKNGDGSGGSAGDGKNKEESPPRFKQVHLIKHDSDELGMAILGGKEHGLPIMISEIFPDSSVGRAKNISAGDVILSVNGDSFDDMTHIEAVRYLSSLRGTIRFDLENTIEADIDKVCDMENRYYDFHDPGKTLNGSLGEDERRESNNKENKIPPITPPASSAITKTINKSKEGSSEKNQLPEVHLSPRKTPHPNN